MKNNSRGFILVGVLAVMIALMILIPALISWVGNEARWGVKSQKNTTAFNLAEAGADRAYWKVKSSTAIWASALANAAPTGYKFDTTYRDVNGGTYRIRITSGVAPSSVYVYAEGRDTANKQTRAIRTELTDQSIPGALISGGLINESGTAIVHWGPMMAMNNINLSGTAATRHFPRKLSRQAVVGTAGNPRDTNGVNPPNTDNVEWWSAYDVPELPVFDFTVLRASAVATGTLNCNGTSSGGGGGGSGSTIACGSACVNCTVQNLYKDPRYLDGDVWYWDNNVSMSGSNGIKGTVIVLGNMTTSGTDNYDPPSVHVPTNAWQEYQDFDTSSNNQYPADNGLRSNATTYNIGSCVSCEVSASGGDVGFYGFLYVGGTITLAGDSDVYGAVWVENGWSGAGNVMIFYDDTLKLPQRNVTLVRTGWQEVGASTTTWAP